VFYLNTKIAFFDQFVLIGKHPNAKNLMRTVTDNNQLAFFRIADYTKLSNGTENNVTPIVARSQDLAFEEIKKFSE